MIETLRLPLTKLAERIRTRKLSPVEITESCLNRITATEGSLNAYVRVMSDAARAAAKRAEAEIAGGVWKGPLHGVPVAIKDLYDIAGVPTTASSRQREHWIPETDSAVVAKLKSAGAVIVGKTHTHEFAYGGITPQTHNPWDVCRSPGGSSGGSAATLATGGAFMATGTDTAGSIRLPAALCGVVGLKATFGRISRFGVTPLSWSLDHAGALTRTAEDAAVCLQLLAGYDARDPDSLAEPLLDLGETLQSDVPGLRIGVPCNYFFDRVDAEVEGAVRGAAETLASLGATLVPVTIPMADDLFSILRTIEMPEASAYHTQMLQQTPELYTDDVRSRLESGMLVPAVRYIHAQRSRTVFKQRLHELFEHVDIILAPSVPVPAGLTGTTSIIWPDGTEERLAVTYIRFTILADVAGVPALTVPCGFTRSGLPIGLQLIGRPLDEATVLRAGVAYERATDWHCRYPPIGNVGI
ncbi:MAG: amidase [Rhodanobacteraceae bacterium]